MRLSNVIAVSLFLAFLSEGETQVAESADSRLQNIRQRLLRENQPLALSEAATLPPEVALPFLSRCLQVYHGENGAFFDAALSAIVEVPDYDRYFADKLAAISKRGGVDNETFKVLSYIGTARAQAVVAPYLFDFAATPNDGHIRSEVNALSAAITFGEMNLREAPTKAKPDSYKSKDVIAWQNWAINRGLVASSQRAFVPQWLIDIELPGAISGPSPSLPPAPSNLATPVQMANAALGTTPAPQTDQTPAATVVHKSPVWPWLSGAIALIAVVVFAWRRRA